MLRSIQVSIALVAVVLVARPFDCFAAGAKSQKIADCCLKGKCVPTANSDECCKNTVPGAGPLVTSKAAGYSSSPIARAAARIPILISPLMFDGLVDPVRHPPPRFGLTAPSLPLII
jgi:hypothetical protein